MIPQPTQHPKLDQRRGINRPPESRFAADSAEWSRELLRRTDDWIVDSGVERLLAREFTTTDPRNWHWVDVYPRWPAEPDSAPTRMLADWRSREWKRIEFLYLHLPYCAQRCHFCYYFVSTDTSRSGEYLPALREEVRTFLSELPADATAGDLFFGGGTPSMMAVDDLRVLYDEVYEHIAQDRIGMVTLELHPRTMRKDIHRLAESGHIRRVSAGVQSFSRPVLEANGRIYVDPDRIRKVCARFLDAGVEHIGLDFMVGLHTQTADDVLTDVRHIHALAQEGLIDSVSVYPRSFTEVWGPFSGEVVDEAVLAEKFRCHLLYRHFFAGLGWQEGPMYLFTAPTFSANVPSALVDAAATAQSLAFGNSARSSFADTQYLNRRDPDDYLEAVGEHGGATFAHVPFTRAVRNRRHLHFGVKRGHFDEADFPVEPTAAERARLDDVTGDLVERELVVRDGTRVELTQLGMLLVELVHQEYDRTFPEPATT